MITRVSDEAVALGEALTRRIESYGGMALVRRAAAEPGLRDGFAESVFLDAGVWELSPLDDQLELEAAAVACRVAGSFAFPYPVAERIARDGGAGATALIARTGHRLASHVDLDLAWSALDLTGQRYILTARQDEPAGIKLGPFAYVVDAVPTPGDTAARLTALLTTLQSWWLLGLLESALAGTVRYSGEREQFGRRLRAFQGVSFQLAESSVAVRSLDELAKYTAWSVSASDDATALTDAIALRVAALRAAETVMRCAHQVHGAMGFTDEVDTSWFSRSSQSVRRLPEDQTATLTLLHDRIHAGGFDGLAGTWKIDGGPEQSL